MSHKIYVSCCPGEEWFNFRNRLIQSLLHLLMSQTSALREPLLVYADDDPDDLFLIEETLQTIYPSLTMRGCTSGKEAYTLLESLPPGEALPCVIILDLNMPGWGGLQTLDAIRANNLFREIPVFIFTNSDHPGHRESALSKGAVDFITKPYRREDLVRVCSLFAAYAKQPARFKTV